MSMMQFLFKKGFKVLRMRIGYFFKKKKNLSREKSESDYLLDNKKNLLSY